jgi:hypothetical protein
LLLLLLLLPMLPLLLVLQVGIIDDALVTVGGAATAAVLLSECRHNKGL